MNSKWMYPMVIVVIMPIQWQIDADGDCNTLDLGVKHDLIWRLTEGLAQEERDKLIEELEALIRALPFVVRVVIGADVHVVTCAVDMRACMMCMGWGERYEERSTLVEMEQGWNMFFPTFASKRVRNTGWHSVTAQMTTFNLRDRKVMHQRTFCSLVTLHLNTSGRVKDSTDFKVRCWATAWQQQQHQCISQKQTTPASCVRMPTIFTVSWLLTLSQ